MHRVLVIDDEEIILENIKFVLELEEYEVLTASSAEEGIRIFTVEAKKLDAVVTDMKMPRLSGMDVLRKVKEIMPEMSVIILTGHGDLENAIHAMKEGAFEYLRKPVNADDLTIAINNAVNKKNLLLENARMQQEILEQNRYMKGLQDSAQKILMNILPKQLPDIPGFRCASRYKSCDAVGGDMYEIYDLGDYIGIYVSDVSSHGILASVITIIIKSFLQNTSYNYQQGMILKSFSEIVSDLNNELILNTAQNVFATMFVAFIEKKTKMLYYISAGHIPQYLFNEDRVLPLKSTGAILGVFEDEPFPSGEVQLMPGDKLLLFTDGITEASSGGQMFGNDNILSMIEKHKSIPIDSLLNNIFESVTDFCGGDFQDDLTLLGLEVME
ncbi:MAG: fused response regulator/phosphatase [Clostridia bacterium]|nr:fused response regulator/phosphatase [Clostridia bacterium]